MIGQRKLQILIHGKKQLLFIFPWFKVGGADKFNYDLISNLDPEKYDITILTTEPSDYIWRQQFEKCAEVFDLTSFLSRTDWAAFIHYIINTRKIDLVMISNSFYAYYAIPWLKSEFPNVIFTDYLHSIDFSWRNGGYPLDSVAISEFLDKTYVCTNSLSELLCENYGRKKENVKTVYIGVNSQYFDETLVDINDYPEITKHKSIYEGKKILLFLSRISIEKRPLLMLNIFAQLCKDRNDLILFVVGNGPELDSMKKLSKKLKINDKIIWFGFQSDVRPFYKLADLLVICSLVEGLTITTYESLSMGTPVVSADVGGQKELVSETIGAIVQNIQSAEKDLYNTNYSKEEINNYVSPILEFIDFKSANPKIQEICRNSILTKFTINTMYKTFDMEFTNLIKDGSSILKSEVKNKNLYKQYLMLYNQMDLRFYGNNNSFCYNNSAKYKLREKLWSHTIYRSIVKLLKKIGLWQFFKKIFTKNI